MSRRVVLRRIPGVSIYKPTKRSGEDHAWLVRYKEDGRVKVETASIDYDVTVRYAMEVSRRLDSKRLGLWDEAANKLAEHALKPLLPARDDKGNPILKEERPTPNHLGDYIALLISRRRSDKWCQMVESRVIEILDTMEASKVSDLSQDAIELGIATLVQQEGFAPQTAVHYLKAMKQFCRWMRRSGRVRVDHAENIEPYKLEDDIRHRRRALDEDEIEALLKAAESGADHEQGSHVITGPQRAMVYLLALETGLRANELRQLRPESFVAGIFNQHYVIVEAKTSKHRRKDEQLLRESVWTRLKKYVAGRANGELIWDLVPKTAIMIREDLAAAKLEYKTDAGLADFHALRHTFCTRLGRSGESMKTCQQLMRHGDIRLTARYMHATRMDEMRALNTMPEHAAAKPTPEVKSA